MSFAGLYSGEPGGASSAHVGSAELVLFKVVAFEENSVAVWGEGAEVAGHVVEREPVDLVLMVEEGVQGGELGGAELAAEEVGGWDGVDREQVEFQLGGGKMLGAEFAGGGGVHVGEHVVFLEVDENGGAEVKGGGAKRAGNEGGG